MLMKNVKSKKSKKFFQNTKINKLNVLSKQPSSDLPLVMICNWRSNFEFIQTREKSHSKHFFYWKFVVFEQIQSLSSAPAQWLCMEKINFQFLRLNEELQII